MYTNGSITLFNRIELEENIIYQVTVIDNVYIECRNQIKVQTIGNDISNGVIVAIPINQIKVTNDRQYIKPKKFNELENKKYNWTLQDGDFFIKGAVLLPEEYTFNSLMEEYDNVYKINQIKDFRIGSPTIQHFLIEGI